jgi:putative membrane protein
MFFYGLSSLLFWLLLVMGVFAVVRSSAWGGRVPHLYQGCGAPGPYDQPRSPSSPGSATAEQILAERFARGEIDEEEFWQRMTALRAGRPDDHSAAAH